jgi:hypothetical protein
MTTLACEHKFHYDCINKWFSAEIIRCGDEDDGGVGVFAPLENKKLQLNYDDRLLFKCPVCRCEYGMRTPGILGTYSGLIEFKKVIAKINYDKQGYEKIQHYILDVDELLIYMSKRNALSRNKAFMETKSSNGFWII